MRMRSSPTRAASPRRYAEIIGTFADPNHPEHHAMLEWLGIEKGTDFDPTHFDPADANRRLDAVVLATARTT